MEQENVNVKYAHGPRPKQKLLERARKPFGSNTTRFVPNAPTQLDAPVYPFPPQTPPTGDGASGDRGVSDPSRSGRQLARRRRIRPLMPYCFSTARSSASRWLTPASMHARPQEGHPACRADQDEVQRVILATTGVYQLIAKLFVWQRLASDRGAPPARARCRFRSTRGERARRKGKRIA